MESNIKISKAMKATRLKESSHDAFALSFHRFGCNPPNADLMVHSCRDLDKPKLNFHTRRRVRWHEAWVGNRAGKVNGDVNQRHSKAIQAACEAARSTNSE